MNFFKKDTFELRWVSELRYRLTDNQYNSQKIIFNWTYIVWKIITDKSFRNSLKKIILYAFRWESQIKGTDSADITIFYSNYADKILIVKNESEEKK